MPLARIPGQHRNAPVVPQRGRWGRLCVPGALALGLLAAPLAADAQPPAKVSRVGILSPVVPATYDTWEAFRHGLRELGYVEGQNLAIEFRSAEGKPDRLPGLAAELVRLKVDVIVTGGPPAPLAAKNATSSIPIVFAVVGDPVAEVLVASLARPGGNITGLSSIAPEVVGKQLGLLKEIVPKVSRVAVLQNPSDQAHPPMLRQVEVAVRALGCSFKSWRRARPPRSMPLSRRWPASARAGFSSCGTRCSFFTERGSQPSPQRAASRRCMG